MNSATGPMVALGDGAVSLERGTPVGLKDRDLPSRAYSSAHEAHNRCRHASTAGWGRV